MNQKRLIIVGVILCLAIFAIGCGKKGPPIPPDLPTAGDDATGIDKKKVEIVDDSAKRIYELYGDQEIDEDTPAPIGTIDSLDEVPEELKYLYEKPKEESEGQDLKDNDDNGQTNTE